MSRSGVSLTQDGCERPHTWVSNHESGIKAIPSWTSSVPRMKPQFLITPLLEIYRSAWYTRHLEHFLNYYVCTAAVKSSLIGVKSRSPENSHFGTNDNFNPRAAGYDVSLIAEPLIGRTHDRKTSFIWRARLWVPLPETHMPCFTCPRLSVTRLWISKFISGFFSWLLSRKMYRLVSILVRATLTSLKSALSQLALKSPKLP